MGCQKMFPDGRIFIIINILVEKAFADDWFNETYDLNLQKGQFTELLKIARTKQLFQFNGQLHEKIDRVAMGSPLGPLMANVFLCHLEDKFTRDGMMPTLYKRDVDDTLVRMRSTDAATDFLTTLNSLHPSLSFTMELPIITRFPLLALRSVRAEQRSTHKYIESQQTLACCCIFIGTQSRAIKTA